MADARTQRTSKTLRRPASPRRRYLWAPALLALGACAYSDPGTGTNTLEAIVKLTYSANDPNQMTVVTANVNKGGVAAPNPNIVIVDTDTNTTYPVGQSVFTTYTGTIAGFHRHVQVEVSSGSDNLTCNIEGPGRHTITNPLNTALESAGEDLSVSWQTTDGLAADEVDIKLVNAQYLSTLAHDGGGADVARGNLRVGPDTLTVLRRNKLVPAGGTGNSVIAFEYGASVGFTLD